MATGWSVHYITHELSLGTLILLGKGQSKGKGKPKGIWADQNLNADKLKEMGFDLMG